MQYVFLIRSRAGESVSKTRIAWARDRFYIYTILFLLQFGDTVFALLKLDSLGLKERWLLQVLHRTPDTNNVLLLPPTVSCHRICMYA